jgi:large subunit ribosomal protein L6
VSRVAKNPLLIPSGVEVDIKEQHVKVKGAKGAMEYDVHHYVSVAKEDKLVRFTPKEGLENAHAIAGTVRALVKNMIEGVVKGFERKLNLVGVGYRAQVQGKTLNLSLGFSHPIQFSIPQGITIETPSQTEIIVRGADRRVVGQVAAQIRGFRPPEPYKGKGVMYDGEVIVRKEGKKK